MSEKFKCCNSFTITKKSFVLHSLTSRRPKKKVVNSTCLPCLHFTFLSLWRRKSRVRETTSTLFQGNKGRVVEWIHEGRKRRPSLYASKLHVHFIIREGSSDASGASELASTPLTHHFTGSKTITQPPTYCLLLSVHNSVGFVVFMTLGRVQQLHQSGRATISSSVVQNSRRSPTKSK